MEQGHTPESGEFPKLPVYYLAERLGFIETPELYDLGAALVEAMRTNPREAWLPLIEAYQELAMRIEQDVKGPAGMKARIGRNIAVAVIRHRAGQFRGYIEDLESGLDDVENLIFAAGEGCAPDIEVEEMERIATVLQEAVDEEKDKHGIA